MKNSLFFRNWNWSEFAWPTRIGKKYVLWQNVFFQKLFGIYRLTVSSSWLYSAFFMYRYGVKPFGSIAAFLFRRNVFFQTIPVVANHFFGFFYISAFWTQAGFFKSSRLCVCIPESWFSALLFFFGFIKTEKRERAAARVKNRFIRNSVYRCVGLT